MRIDVDFNERDRRGHVVARVPGDQVERLTPGRRVYLYDPLERLWAEASVARINPDTRIAAFDVDWHSFADAEVADFTIGNRQWFVGVPPSEDRWVSSVVAENAGVTCIVHVEVSWLAADGNIIVGTAAEHSVEGNSTAGTQTTAAGQ